MAFSPALWLSAILCNSSAYLCHQSFLRAPTSLCTLALTSASAFLLLLEFSCRCRRCLLSFLLGASQFPYLAPRTSQVSFCGGGLGFPCLHNTLLPLGLSNAAPPPHQQAYCKLAPHKVVIGRTLWSTHWLCAQYIC